MNYEVSEIFDATKHESYRSYDNTMAIGGVYTFYINIGGHIIMPYRDSAHQCGFKTVTEAEHFRDEMLAQLEDDYDNMVYAVFKDNGVRKLVHIFKKASNAYEYVVSQNGWGGQVRQMMNYGVNIHGEVYGSVSYEGHEIVPTVLE